MRTHTLLLALGIVAVAASCQSNRLAAPGAQIAAPNPAAICLTGLAAHEWSEVTEPATAQELRAKSVTSFAVPLNNPSEHWYRSGEKLLYCRMQDWCIAEAWQFAPEPSGNFAVAAHNSWVCVTGPNNSSKPTPLRGAA